MMSAKLVLVLVALIHMCSVNAAVEETIEEARLMLSKSVLNYYLVEGLDLVVRYNIYNVGNLPAVNVQLEDGNFGNPTYFEFVSGFNKMNWAKIAPQSNVTHVAVIRPKVAGYVNLTQAVISYQPNEKSSRVQIGHSVFLGEAPIQTFKDYNRRFASHTIDWILFGVMAMPSILFPYLLWLRSASKYEAISKAAKGAKAN